MKEKTRRSGGSVATGLFQCSPRLQGQERAAVRIAQWK
jgi:hypothetical protein